MTPESPLGRLAAAIEEKFRNYNQKRGDIQAAKVYMQQGGELMLSLLLEPGEACGPRFIVDLFADTLEVVRQPETFKDARKVEYVPLAELLQARAALASSEARVRILSEALERIKAREGFCIMGPRSEERDEMICALNGDVEELVRRAFELGSARTNADCASEASQALLEVQR